MKRLILLVLIFVMGVSIYAEDKYVIALMNFAKKDRESTYLMEKFNDELPEMMEENGKFEFIDRAKLESALDEGLGITIDDAIFADEVELVLEYLDKKPDYFIFGSVRKTDSETVFKASYSIVDCKVFEVQTHEKEMKKVSEDREAFYTDIINTVMNFSEGKIKEKINLIIQFVSTQRYKEAEPLADEVIKLAPDSYEAHYYKGMIRSLLNDNESAKASYIKSIELKPDYGDAYEQLGFIFLLDEDYENAIKYYKIYVENAPDNVKAHYNLALALKENEDYEEAITEFGFMLEIEDTNWVAVKSVADCYFAMEEYNEAIPYYEKFLEANPDDEAASLNLTKCFKETDQVDRYIAQLKDKIDKNPMDVNTYLKLGRTYYSEEMYNEAIDAYNKIIEVNPAFEQAYKYIADIYVRNFEDYNKAEEYARKLLDVNAESPFAFLTLGDVYFKRANNYFKKYADFRNQADETVGNNKLAIELGDKSIIYKKKASDMFGKSGGYYKKATGIDNPDLQKYVDTQIGKTQDMINKTSFDFSEKTRFEEIKNQKDLYPDVWNE